MAFRGIPHGRMRELPYDRQGPHREPPHRLHTSDTALNIRMSQESPPQWGPGRQRAYPFRIWVKELRKWVTMCKAPKEKQALLVYAQLQGVASAQIQSWLNAYVSGISRFERRNKRLEAGNRAFRRSEWKKKLEIKRQEALLDQMAKLQIETRIFGRHGDYRRREQGPRKGKGKGHGKSPVSYTHLTLPTKRIV